MVYHLEYCQDPIKKHKKRITKNLRKVTDLIVQKCDGKLIKGSLLCVNCWTMILQTPSVISTIESSSENSDQVDDNQSNSSASKEVLDSENNSFEDADLTNPVLQLLDQTPVKKSEYE
jgi:hypothetical protein